MEFLHLLWHDDLKFFPLLVSMLEDESNGLFWEKHAFITPYRRVYEALKGYGNVIFEKAGDSDSAMVKCLRNNSDSASWFFLHGAIRKKAILLLDKKILQKTILRSWGGDLLFDSSVQSIRHSFANKIKHLACSALNPFLKSHYRLLRAIGVANIVDELYIKGKIGQVPMVRLGYASKDTLDFSERIHSFSHTENKGTFDVLVGHAGTPGDNHLKMLELLSRYAGENIRVNLVLSYGNSEYISLVSKKAKEAFGSKCRVITDMMPRMEYISFLNDMDIAILDDVHSSALGNLAWLVALEKTIYVNSESLYKKAMKIEGIPFRTTNMIKSLTFKEFYTPLQYEKPGINSGLAPAGYADYVEDWRTFLTSLNNAS